MSVVAPVSVSSTAAPVSVSSTAAPVSVSSTAAPVVMHITAHSPDIEQQVMPSDEFLIEAGWMKKPVPARNAYVPRENHETELAKLMYDAGWTSKDKTIKSVGINSQQHVMELFSGYADSGIVKPSANSVTIMHKFAVAIACRSKDIDSFMKTYVFELRLPFLLNASITHGYNKNVELILEYLKPTDKSFCEMMVRTAIRNNNICSLLKLLVWKDINALRIAIKEKNELMIEVLLANSNNFKLTISDIVAASSISAKIFKAIMVQTKMSYEDFRIAVIVLIQLNKEKSVIRLVTSTRWNTDGMVYPEYLVIDEPVVNQSDCEPIEVSKTVTEARDKVTDAIFDGTAAIAKSHAEATALAKSKVALAKAEVDNAIINAKTAIAKSDDEAIAAAKRKVAFAQAELTVVVINTEAAIAKSEAEAVATARSKVASTKAEVDVAIIDDEAEAAKVELAKTTITFTKDLIVKAEVAKTAAESIISTTTTNQLMDAITDNNVDEVSRLIKMYNGNKNELLKRSVIIPKIKLEIIKLIAAM